MDPGVDNQAHGSPDFRAQAAEVRIRILIGAHLFGQELGIVPAVANGFLAGAGRALDEVAELPLDPPPPYMPYVYWSWSLPIFTPWAALPWETAWFVYRVFNVIIFAWSAWWAYRQHPVATALLVLGPDAGMKLAERESIAAYFLLRLGSEFEERISSLFATKVLKE